MSRNKTLSIVVPVFNEEETLQYTHSRLSALPALEIIYVNDGSRDGSARILNELEKSPGKGPKVRHLEFSRNFGHSSAVLAGLEAAQGELIAIIDADLQDPPELIPEMCKEIDGGFDVVYGLRVRREGETLFKRFTAWAFYRLLEKMAGVKIPRDTGDFRVITHEVRDAVISCREREPFLRGIVAWVGFRQKAHPYARQSRKFGETKYPFRKMLRFAIHAVLSFSSTPLFTAFWLGAIGFAGCMVIGGWAAWVNWQGRAVSGWTSLLMGFMLGQSATLLLLGVMGAYLSRMYSELQGRPRYIVRRPNARASAEDRAA